MTRTGGDSRRARHNRSRTNRRASTAPPACLPNVVRRSGPFSRSRTRIVKYSDPLASAPQAIRRWSGECAASPRSKKALAFGFFVAIEHDRLQVRRPRGAANKRVLAAVTVAREIGEGAVGLGNGGIVFLDAPAHLRDEAGLKLFRSGEGCLRIGILLLEAGADLGIENRRILENLPPVLRLQPCVIILDPDAMNIEDIGFGGSRGGSRQQMKRRSLQDS